MNKDELEFFYDNLICIRENLFTDPSRLSASYYLGKLITHVQILLDHAEDEDDED